MINTDRSWVWLALVILVFAAWRFYFRPKLDKYNRDKDEEEKGHNETQK